MKECYIAPELERICLLSAEAVAVLPNSFDDYMGGEPGGGSTGNGVVVDPDTDIDAVLP